MSKEEKSIKEEVMSAIEEKEEEYGKSIFCVAFAVVFLIAGIFMLLSGNYTVAVISLILAPIEFACIFIGSTSKVRTIIFVLNLILVFAILIGCVLAYTL